MILPTGDPGGGGSSGRRVGTGVLGGCGLLRHASLWPSPHEVVITLWKGGSSLTLPGPISR